MKLYGECGQARNGETAIAPVEQRHVGFLDAGWKGFPVDGKSVVHRDDFDAPGFEVVSVSDPYADRGASVLVRVFLEARLDAPTVRVTSTTGLARGRPHRALPPADAR